MKTNSAALRVIRLPLSIAALAAAALAALNLCVVDGGYRNASKTSLQQTSTLPVWNGSVTGSELFVPIR